MPKVAKHPYVTLDEFVALYGEAMRQVNVAKLIGFGRSTVCTMCGDGRLDTTPDGAVLTRSLYEYLFCKKRRY
ncbi:hypothetical protein LJC07_03955 [Christensenellaceae bacterium OttesenSCG-928-L17]|nr:hypothetical protein [Christensenellaceae bacterium OttesenSCG-928-L17]